MDANRQTISVTAVWPTEETCLLIDRVLYQKLSLNTMEWLIFSSSLLLGCVFSPLQDSASVYYDNSRFLITRSREPGGAQCPTRDSNNQPAVIPFDHLHEEFFLHVHNVPYPQRPSGDWLGSGISPNPSKEQKAHVLSRDRGVCVLTGNDCVECGHVIPNSVNPEAFAAFWTCLTEYARLIDITVPAMDLDHPGNLITLSSDIRRPLDEGRWSVYFSGVDIQPDISRTLELHCISTGQCNTVNRAIPMINQHRANKTSNLGADHVRGTLEQNPAFIQWYTPACPRKSTKAGQDLVHPIIWRLNYSFFLLRNFGSSTLKSIASSLAPLPQEKELVENRKKLNEEQHGKGIGGDATGAENEGAGGEKIADSQLEQQFPIHVIEEQLVEIPRQWAFIFLQATRLLHLRMSSGQA